MHASRIIAPFAVATLVTGAVPVLEHNQATTFTSVEIALTHATDQLSQGYSAPTYTRHDHEDGDSGEWGDHGGSQNWWGGGLNLDFSGFLASIIKQLTANNGGLLSAIQTAVSSVITDLANGSSIGQALSNAGQQLATAVGGNLGKAIQTGLDKIGQLLTIAPKLISGALTIAAALPSAVAPVVGAVTVAVTNVLGALGSADLNTVIATGIKNVTSAVAQGISTIAAVVQKVLTGQTVTATAATAVVRTATPATAEVADPTPVADSNPGADASEPEATAPAKDDTEAPSEDSDASAPVKAGSARTARTVAAAPTGTKKAADSAADAGAEKSSTGASGGSARPSTKRGAHSSAE